GAGASDDPNNGVDSDSNGRDIPSAVRTASVSFFSSMPTAEDDLWVFVLDDRLSDLTIDIGLIQFVLGDTGVDGVGLKFDYMLWLIGGGLALLLVARRVRRSER